MEQLVARQSSTNALHGNIVTACGTMHSIHSMGCVGWSVKWK